MKYVLVFLTMLCCGVARADARDLKAKAAAAAVLSSWEPRPVVAAISDAIRRIALLKEVDAWRTGKPVWLHFTDKPNCKPCERAEEMHQDAGVVAESQGFACVSLCNCDPGLRQRIREYGVTTFPTDIFISADRQTVEKREGCPADAAAYRKRLRDMARAVAAAP